MLEPLALNQSSDALMSAHETEWFRCKKSVLLTLALRFRDREIAGDTMYTLIQKPAPDFTADAVMPNGEFQEITLSSFRDRMYVALFFYPLDFTFVCPSEIIAFSKRVEAFKKLEYSNFRNLGGFEVLPLCLAQYSH